MEDLSLHVLDICENSVRARAARIEITLTRDRVADLFSIVIHDDGSGMDTETLAQVRSPFFTTKGKKTGLGIPFLAQAAELAGGGIDVESTPGAGTRVSATFRWSNIDRPALGDMAGTVATLLAGHPDIDIVYEEWLDNRSFSFDTRELRKELEGVPLNTPAVLDAIRNLVREQTIIAET